MGASVALEAGAKCSRGHELGVTGIWWLAAGGWRLASGLEF